MAFTWKPIPVPKINTSTAPSKTPLGPSDYFDQWKNTSQGRSAINREVNFAVNLQYNGDENRARREIEARIKKDFGKSDFYKNYTKGYESTYQKQYAAWSAANKSTLDLATDIKQINEQGVSLASAYASEKAKQPIILAESEKILGQLKTEAGTELRKTAAQTQRAKTQESVTQSNLRIQQQVLANQNRLALQRQRTSSVGAPKQTFTRVTRPSVGGYGGTAPGRINPTGLNI